MGSVETGYQYIDLPLLDETYIEISMEDEESEASYKFYMEVSELPEYMSDHIQNQNSLIPSRDIDGYLEGEVDDL